MSSCITRIVLTSILPMLMHFRFESMQLHECTNCSCDYLQFENSEFSQRICSYKDIQINRPYKCKLKVVLVRIFSSPEHIMLKVSNLDGPAVRRPSSVNI